MVHLLHKRCLPNPCPVLGVCILQTPELFDKLCIAVSCRCEACPLLLPFFRCAEACCWACEGVINLKHWCLKTFLNAKQMWKVDHCHFSSKLDRAANCSSDNAIASSGVHRLVRECARGGRSVTWRHVLNIFECAELDRKISEVYRVPPTLLRSIQPLTLSGLEGRRYQLQDVARCCKALSGLEEWKAKWPSGQVFHGSDARLGIISGTVVMTWRKPWNSRCLSAQRALERLRAP